MAWPCLAFAFLMSCGQPDVPAGSLDALIPLPQQIEKGGSDFQCDGVLSVSWPDGWSAERAVVESWFAQAGIRVRSVEGTEAGLRFVLDPSESRAEAYVLNIDSEGVAIQAGTAAGLFRGWMTLRKMMPVACETGCSGGFALPGVAIEDAPAMEHRGLLLDG